MPRHREGGKNISKLQRNRVKWRFGPGEHWHKRLSAGTPPPPCKQSLILQRHIVPESTLSARRMDKGAARRFSHLSHKLSFLLIPAELTPFHSETRIQSGFSFAEALPAGGSSPPQPFSGSGWPPPPGPVDCMSRYGVTEDREGVGFFASLPASPLQTSSTQHTGFFSAPATELAGALRPRDPNREVQTQRPLWRRPS